MLVAEIDNLKKAASGMEALVNSTKIIIQQQMDEFEKQKNEFEKQKDEFKKHTAETREMQRIEAARLRVWSKFSCPLA